MKRRYCFGVGSTSSASHSPSKAKKLTVLLFQDNAISRTFEFSLHWLLQLGVGIGALMLTALLTSALALKFYWASRSADPARLADLEATIQKLQDDLVSQSGSKDNATEEDSEPSAPSAAPQPSEISQTHESGLLLALPTTIKTLPPTSRSPVDIDQLQAIWSGRTLKVQFNINYTLTDGGSQKGRLLILGRGSDSVYGYPKGIFTWSGDRPLISTGNGEFFSVRRIRPTVAQIGPLPDTASLKSIHMLILSQDDQLLMSRIISVPERKIDDDGSH